MARQMKDSGIEWIGEIPETWTISKNKYLLDSMYSGGTPSASNSEFYAEAEGTPFVSISDMSATDYVLTTKKSLTPAGIADKGLLVLPAGTDKPKHRQIIHCIPNPHNPPIGYKTITN